MRRWCAVAAVIGAALLTALGADGRVRAQPAPAAGSAIADYGACVAAQHSGDLLLLIDESGSLQQTDPDSTRVKSAELMLERLVAESKSNASGLNVAIAGFSTQYTLRRDWTPLTADSLPGLTASMDEFRGRNTGADTDYAYALTGALNTLTSHRPAAGEGSATPCRAIVWFTDGQPDFSTGQGRSAHDMPLDTDPERLALIDKVTGLICDGSAAIVDQVRGAGVKTFAVGLNVDPGPAGFQLLQSIATGQAPGKTCGQTTGPSTGAFFSANDINDLLFAFNSFVQPDPQFQTGVCELKICATAEHKFVLDDSIEWVSVLASADTTGLVPKLIAPNGETADLSGSPEAAVTVGGAPTHYKWLTPQTISFEMTKSAPGGQWPGRWGLVFVDPTGDAAAAHSRSVIHIAGNLAPRWLDEGKQTLHTKGHEKLRLGVVRDGREQVKTTQLLGAATLSVALVDTAGRVTPLAPDMAKSQIGQPVAIDLDDVAPGPATLRLTLVVTTAPARLPGGGQEPGTTLTPEQVDYQLSIAPPAEYPTVHPMRLDFGSLDGTGRRTSTLNVAGNGCVWLGPARFGARPAGVGTPVLTDTGPRDAAGCGSTSGSISVTLRVDHQANGFLSGVIPVHLVPRGTSDPTITENVAFGVTLEKKLQQGTFWMVLLLTLLLGPGIPLLLLYALKWATATIPSGTVQAQEFDIRIDRGTVLRDGEPFALRADDLVEIVRRPEKRTRRLDVCAVALRALVGLSPFGVGHVRAYRPGFLAATAAGTNPSDRHGGARLPLAVHNKWLVLHDPAGPADAAKLVMLVGADTSEAFRVALAADACGRIPDIVARLRGTGESGGGAADPPQPTDPTDPFAPAAEWASGSDSDPFSGAKRGSQWS